MSNAPKVPGFPASTRYRPVRELGVGGMGVVYEAVDVERGGRRVALKVLRGQNAEAIARLKREFRSLHDVRHPNLVALYELCAEGDTWFLTLELVEGVDFLAWVRPAAPLGLASDVPTADLVATVRSGGPPRVVLDEARLLTAFRQLAEGVAFLHGRGRLHRDLKPSNVLVTKEGRVVILDFGLVTGLDGPASLSEAQGQAIVGTVAYMAPEQAGSGPVGPPSDWYAFGVMLFQALTGRLPFEGAPVEVMLDKQRRPAPAPRAIDPDVPERLDALCVRLLRTAPSERPEGPEVLAALGGVNPVPLAVPAPGAQLAGREAELERLHAAFEETRRNGPRIVRVQGPSGIGKTALLKAFAMQLEQRGAVVLEGRCHERETVPFKALDPVIDALTRRLAAMPPERVEVFRPRDAALLAGMFPVLRRLPVFQQAPGRDVADPLERRRRAVQALRELFERLAERAPLVVLVDDGQWGDADSVAVMEALLRPPEPPPVLVVTSIRDGGPELPPGPVPVEVVALGPLSPTALRDIASAAGLDAARLDALVSGCQGNPLLFLQLLELAGEDEVTVEALWRRKVTGLETAGRALLEAVSVAGAPIDATVALEVAGVPPQQADVVQQLEGNHLVRVLPDERRLEPWQEGLRAVVMSGLAGGREQELHQRLALALAARADGDLDAIARHWTAAGNGERAAEATLVAAGQARAQLAFARAAALFRRALELLPADDRRRASLWVDLGHSLASAGQGRAAADAFRRACTEPGAEPGQRLELERLAAEQLLVSGHVDDGVAAMSRVLAGLGMTLAKTPARAVGALLWRRWHLSMRGLSFEERPAQQVAPALLSRIDACWSVSVGLGMVDTIRGASFQTRQLLLALEAGEPWRVARALAAEAAFVATEGVRAEHRARELLDRARALCDRVGDARLRGLLAFCEGLTRFLVGDFRQARARVAEAESHFRDAGLDVSWEAANSRLFSIWSLFYLGEIAELSRRVPALVQDAVSRGDRYAVTSLTVGLSTVARLARGEAGGARADVEAAMAGWSSTSFHFQHYWALLSGALIGLYEGTPGPALERLVGAWQAVERSMLLRIENVRVEAWALRGRLAVAAGRADEARRALGVLRRERAGWARAQATLLGAWLEPARRADLLTEAVAAFEREGLRLFAAAARWRLGQLLQGEVGRAHLRAAKAWFEVQDVREPESFARLVVPQLSS